MKYTDGFILAVMAGNITDDMNSNSMVYFKPRTGHMYNIYIYTQNSQTHATTTGASEIVPYKGLDLRD